MYLRSTPGLPADLAELLDAEELGRRLTRDERRRLDKEIRAACRRVQHARELRDGHT